MARDWRDMSLGDFVNLKRGYDLPTAERRPGPYPVISSSGLTGTHCEGKVQGPGVITGRYGTLGEVFYVEEDFWPLNTTLYVEDFKRNDPKFVAYFLRELSLDAHNDKSSVPGLNRNDLHRLIVRVPDLAEQRAIASVLGALDDKIQLNRRMNETLEAIARAIFKSWFGDFDPVHAKAEGRKPFGMDDANAALFPDRFGPDGLPEGWKIKSLDHIADFLNGLALQKFPASGDDYLPVIKIAELRAGITEKSGKASRDLPEEYVVNDGDVLFSWSGSLMHVIWTGGQGALNQHLFKVTSTSYPKWFFYFWIAEHMSEFRAIAASKATTMGHIQRAHLAAAETVVPSQNLIEAADHILSPIFDRMVSNSLESRTLAQMRDLLLPKLMSGEIRVNNAGHAVRGAV